MGKGRGEGAKARAGLWEYLAPKMGKAALIKNSDIQSLADEARVSKSSLCCNCGL